MQRKGRLIVIEGSDGSGKTTQLALLKNYCDVKKIQYRSFKFPQYETSFFGKMIGNFLRGEYGDLATVNPYLISVIYAMDRAQARDTMNKWINSGKYILLDRYSASNAAHQCGRLPKKEHDKYLTWLETLEYSINKIPKEDIVVYLSVPPGITWKLLANADRAARKYAPLMQKDLVEKNFEYLEKSYETYEFLCRKYPRWIKINCVKNGEIRGRQEIHHEIIKKLKERKLLSI